MTAKPSRGRVMESIRLKVTIRLNRNHSVNIQELEALKPLVERAVASCLPDWLAIDTVKVTRIKDAATSNVQKV